MALPPDTPNESFLREVDENLRRDQMEQFAKRYGKWLIAAVVLFLVATAAYLYWENRQQAKSADRSEELSGIFADIAAGRNDQAKRRLQPLQQSDNEIVRGLSTLTDAALALETNDTNTALARYRTLSSDDDMPDAFRNIGLVRATALEFDRLKPEEVIARLEPLAKPGEPWFGAAGEMTAMAYLKQGQRDKAGRLFAAIAADKQVPDSLRNRAVQIAGTLGIDATASAPQNAQPGSTQ